MRRVILQKMPEKNGEEMKWIKLADESPPERVPLLVYMSCCCRGVQVGYLVKCPPEQWADDTDKFAWHVNNHIHGEDTVITYWALLPEPPKEES